MNEEHPIAQLRRRLAAEFVNDLPAGVHPVAEYCGEPQFFPGATGLLTEQSWDEVREGMGAPAGEELPPADVRVMVVGNYHASRRSYERIVAREIGGLGGTWGKLKKLLARVPPTEVFLTNAFIGYPELGSDTARFPATREYFMRCAQFLALEVALLRPACVISLGRHSSQMLATIATGLEAWLPWRRCDDLEAQNARLCAPHIGGVHVTALATRHPSSAVSNAYLSAEAEIIGRAFTDQ